MFAVALLPLLSGDIQVKRLIFDGAEVRLRAKEDGSANWTFPTEEDSEQSTLEDLRLDNVQLNDSLITFEGAEGGAPLTLEDMDATLSLQSLDNPAALTAAFNYREERVSVDSTIGLPRAVLEKGETPITAEVRSDPLNASFDGNFNAETGALAGAVETRGASLRRLLAWIGSPMSEGGGFGAFARTAQWRATATPLSLNDATSSLDDINASGNLAIAHDQRNDRLRVDGALTAPRIDLNTYLPAPAQGAKPAASKSINTAWSNDPIDLPACARWMQIWRSASARSTFSAWTFSSVQRWCCVSPSGAADARLARLGLYGGAGPSGV